MGEGGCYKPWLGGLLPPGVAPEGRRAAPESGLAWGGRGAAPLLLLSLLLLLSFFLSLLLFTFSFTVFFLRSGSELDGIKERGEGLI